MIFCARHKWVTPWRLCRLLTFSHCCALRFGKGKLHVTFEAHSHVYVISMLLLTSLQHYDKLTNISFMCIHVKPGWLLTMMPIFNWRLAVTFHLIMPGKL